MTTAFAFNISEKQNEQAKAWFQEHERVHHKGKSPYAGAIGGNYSWTFIATGLGDVVLVRCNACNPCALHRSRMTAEKRAVFECDLTTDF